MKGCLAVVGGLAILTIALLFLIGALAQLFGSKSFGKKSGPAPAMATAKHTTPAALTPDSVDSETACGIADKRERTAMDAVEAGRYQAAYDAAVSGLNYNERCDDTDDQLVNHGYLLSAEAFAEHGLDTGDWRTDFNQANALLVQCQTTPSLYGTRTGASCETQEGYNIHATTNWELNQ